MTVHGRLKPGLHLMRGDVEAVAELCIAHLLQVSRIMQRAEADGGQVFKYAATRAALWLLDDFPARLEALLTPVAAAKQVSC